MDIRHENTDALNALLTVKVDPTDYEEKVNQSLKEQRKKAVIKGFRPGKAPAGLINKMYRTPVLAEEVNRLMSESLAEYMKENEIRILGELLPSEDQERVDWETQTEFEFKFDMGLMPEFEIDLNKKNKIPFYIIKVDEETRGKYIEGIRKQFGEYLEAEQSEAESMITVTLSELNADHSPKEDGMNMEGKSLTPAIMTDEEEKKKFIGAKVGDIIVIDTHKAFAEPDKRATFLGVDKENVEDISPLFQATITEVKNFKDAEVNQELYDKAFGPDSVKSEEEFIAKVDESIQNYLRNDSERLLIGDIRRILLEKSEVELPSEFLIRWLTAINEGKYTEEQVRNDYDKFEQDLKWQLIRDKIATDQNIQIEEQEVKDFARAYVSSQMQQYGMTQLPDSFVDGYVNDLMEKQEQRKKFAEGVLENKVIAWIKEAVKLNEKEVSMDEFRTIVEKSQPGE